MAEEINSNSDYVGFLFEHHYTPQSFEERGFAALKGKYHIVNSS